MKLYYVFICIQPTPPLLMADGESKPFYENLRKNGNSSACDCARAAQLAANELEQPGIRPFAAGKL